MVEVATYSYEGPGRLIGTTYDEASMVNADPAPDRFDRPLGSPRGVSGETSPEPRSWLISPASGSDNFEWPWSGPYDARYDIDLDDDIDINDSFFIDSADGTTLGHGVLSGGSLGLRKGYAGYEYDHFFATMCHVRHRVLLTELGRWTRRDPLGYVDGMGLYAYVRNSPLGSSDAMGLFSRGSFGYALGCEFDGRSWICGANPLPMVLPVLDEGGGGGGGGNVPIVGLSVCGPLPVDIPIQGIKENESLQIAVCNQAKQNCAGGDLGGVLCLGKNAVIPCSWHPRTDSAGNGATHRCTREHEQEHIRQGDHDCSKCPDDAVCRAPWGPAHAVTLPMIRINECDAYELEIQCLIAEHSQCMGACQTEIKERCHAATASAKAIWGCDGLLPCPK